MTRINRQLRATVFAAAVAAGAAIAGLPQVAAQTAPAAVTPSAQQAYREIESMFGGVPGFMRAYPQSAIAGSWEVFKNLQLSDKTALDAKTKELIMLGVSAQIPCAYCVHYHQRVARAFGASEQEIQEAVALAAGVRHWSTVLNGMQIDLTQFKQELDAALKFAADKASKTK
ncbi:MAG TPA: carboxymuconolactone decarboxylase family protein [Burkholderiaceae bacterium]|jgi:AhpD family alkylhydroperoxidase|nr:carboxymuconolactone decarboxylase family protein [Burkholderiaceae bacterium]